MQCTIDKYFCDRMQVKCKLFDIEVYEFVKVVSVSNVLRAIAIDCAKVDSVSNIL